VDHPAADDPDGFDLGARIDAFVEAFNVNDLDAVMTFFNDAAVYRPGDGKEHHGKAAIRRAFEPQFSGAYGKMRFDEIDRLLDSKSGKAAIRWICRHDVGGPNGRAIPLPMRLLYRLLMRGERAGWHGLDVFHFDPAGMISAKFSYVSARHPLLEPDLGDPP
jgi:ketosteroid isomerase-like protein